VLRGWSFEAFWYEVTADWNAELACWYSWEVWLEAACDAPEYAGFWPTADPRTPPGRKGALGSAI
jgi:hypothetical protein